ncbi:S1C family serine protease [Amphibacillus sp. Q70]|uniref:S1C family serine protease n=1 Tax=Amphibacillus sp. Q70 TaxID=3453416 RepID=UPI003F827F8B
MTEPKEDRDLIDEDLYEEIDPEEMLELLEIEKANLKEKNKVKAEAKKPRFSRWFYGLIVFVLCLNVIALLPRTFSIPALDFLRTSARLSADQTVHMFKEAVVVIETTDGKGTGFGMTEDGYIVTNHHVIEGEDEVMVNYPEAGLYNGKVISSDEEVDLALVKVDADEAELPYLSLAEEADFQSNQQVLFIGNPLRFNGIANEGEWIGMTARQSLATEVMMLDAPVYRGNSGSPVINGQGEVIGVIYATTNDQELGKLGLAVPIENIDRILTN